ncbi:MAG: hypothetical protein CMG35_04055 [Candidatus Marinimicrobia bacterium]|nr:hypothetical protein [Candidatus Neomarinimicrobiota bacterium]|tara:strand:- start:3898 stop:4296 length:399 start_codon:yes stop_codon:yes gene_type:complete
MYVTEAMINSMEEMQRNAGDMEKHIKAMMETEARMHGLELDSRNNARDMWGQLSAHMANMPADEPVMDEDEEALDDEAHWEQPEMTPMEEAPIEVEHTHADGTTHAHEGGDVEHTHDEPVIEPPSDGTTPHG